MSKANGQFKTFNPIIKCIKRLLRVLVLTCIYWHVWKLFGLVLQAVKSASWIKREVLCYLIITPCKFATPTWDSSSAIIKMNLFNRECHRLIAIPIWAPCPTMTKQPISTTNFDPFSLHHEKSWVDDSFGTISLFKRFDFQTIPIRWPLKWLCKCW